LGRLTQVVEPGGLTTQYSYDSLNNLLSVSQLGNATNGDTPRTRSFSYDSLSRLLSAYNPETSTVSYSYDANSNVHTKTDARGVTTTYQYDALNRLLSKSYSSNANGTPLSCYQYDTSTNGIGRLANSWTLSASGIASCSTTAPTTGFLTKRSILAYDPMGRLLSEQQSTPASQASGIPYSPAYTYDLAGNLTSSTDGTTPVPTQSQTTLTAPCLSSSVSAATLTFVNCPDSAGRLHSVMSNWVDNTHPLWLFSSPLYAAPGGLTNATYGNRLNLTRSYDNRLRITGENDQGSGAMVATPGSATVTITGSEQSQ